MQQHRIWVAITLGWLFLLFNLERVHEPLNIASFVYVQVTLIGVILLLSHWVRRRSLSVLAITILIPFLVLKPLLNYDLLGASLPLTIMEVCILLFSAALFLRIGRDTDAFTESTVQLMTMHLPTRKLASLEIQQDMEREIRRARRHDRPLSLMTLRPQQDSLNENLEEFLQNIENDLTFRFAQGRLAQMLLQETKSADLLGYKDETIVMVLPETDRLQATQLAERIHQRCQQTLGFQVEMGLSEFPVEEITLFGLLDRASSECLTLGEIDSSAPVEQLLEQMELVNGRKA